jgi:hypothetical protein
MSGADFQRVFTAFLATLATDGTPAPDAVAQAFAAHLGAIDPAKLPKAAQPLWQTLRTRLLKAPAGQSPVSPRAIAAIASWPSSRVAELITAIRLIEAEISAEANDRLADETNSQVSRAYL